jgi:hypothetical protein
MRPLLGIELDDASHRQPGRQERDRFVESVFATAGLPLYRQSVRSTYNVAELTVTLKPAAIGTPTPETTDARQHTPDVAAPGPSGQKFESSVSAPLLKADDTPNCPQCGELMVLRTVKKNGPYKGNRFWGCKDYPRCRGVRPFSGDLK